MKTRRFTTSWEVTLLKLETAEGIVYKVSRRMPELHVAETKVYKSQSAAVRQFRAWTRDAR